MNNYPFTSRSVTIGHVVDDDRDLRFQVRIHKKSIYRPFFGLNYARLFSFLTLGSFCERPCQVVSHYVTCNRYDMPCLVLSTLRVQDTLHVDIALIITPEHLSYITILITTLERRNVL